MNKRAILNLAKEKARNKVMWGKLHDIWKKQPSLAVCWELKGLHQRPTDKLDAYQRVLRLASEHQHTLDEWYGTLYLTINAEFCLVNWNTLEYAGFTLYSDIDKHNAAMQKEQEEAKRRDSRILIPNDRMVKHIADITNPHKRKH